MKYYFIGHTTKLIKYLPAYRQIIGTLKKNNWKLVDDWVSREAAAQLDLSSNHERLYKYYKNLYFNTTKHIKQSDLVIAELSEKSTTVSQQVVYALENNIPVWCLCNFDKKINIPMFLSTLTDEKLSVSYYRTDDLQNILEEGLKKYTKREIKFNFYLSQELNDHLQKKSIQLKTTKAELIRQLIIKDIKS